MGDTHVLETSDARSPYTSRTTHRSYAQMAISYTVFRGSSNGEIKQAEVNRGELLPDEVLVRIKYSGVCGTDQHMRHMSVALGHEGVGVVENVGKDVFRVAM
jgi:D-arabinose 1-dehydrogenase-like Zn-dependent alcohol dehydrogenase